VDVAIDDGIAFRLNAHHLSERLTAEALLEVTGACGIQNSPPGSALLAMHARLDTMTSELLDRAFTDDKSLLQTWCMRGSPFYVPTADAGVFTTGVLPTTEPARRHFIVGVEQSLDKLDLSLDDAVALVDTEIRDVLSGTRMAIDELGAELAGRVAPNLSPGQRDTWSHDGPYAKGQPLGEAVVHFCIRILTLQGIVCFAPRAGNKAPFMLVDEWLERPLPQVDPETARAELLRRYLRCYGPSTPKDFATWVGVAAGDVDPWWRLLEGHMVPVEFNGRRTWLLAEDLDAVRSPPPPHGLRLLPPRDPYLQTRDRETIVAKKFHREVWKLVGDPGAVLADGRIVGIWRPRKSGRKLSMTVTAFESLTARRRALISTEAEHVARLRGATSVDVRFED